MDHPRTEYKKISLNQPAELTIYWKQNDPPQTSKQVLKSFGLVDVDIMSEFDSNLKRLKLTVCLFDTQLKTYGMKIFFICLLYRRNYAIRMQRKQQL